MPLYIFIISILLVFCPFNFVIVFITYRVSRHSRRPAGLRSAIYLIPTSLARTRHALSELDHRSFIVAIRRTSRTISDRDIDRAVTTRWAERILVAPDLL